MSSREAVVGAREVVASFKESAARSREVVVGSLEVVATSREVVATSGRMRTSIDKTAASSEIGIRVFLGKSLKTLIKFRSFITDNGD